MLQKIKTIIKFNFIVEFVDFKRINANYCLIQVSKIWLDFHLHAYQVRLLKNT